MGAFDISRNAFFPAKHYSSVRMQQGRVLTDDDWNEQSRILAEAQRRALTEIVGPFGSPDQGFKITNLTFAAGQANFDIQPGVMYLGGLRVEMDRPPVGAPLETYVTQRDWLQQSPNAYPVPTTLASPRYDLVYLDAWEQGVSAVEDNELFETALAGPDTTTRMRLMRRVRIVPNIGEQECRRAWTALNNRLATTQFGQINEEMELVVNTRLQVGFTETGSGDDLCTPAVAGRYLGAENQAIRVELLDATHFTWGFDNASPYYRVRRIDATTVELLDLPKDQHHWPLLGENIELLPWSALLPNREKVAETAGHLSKVTGSYDPNTHRITLANPIPANFNTAWQSRPDASSISPSGETNPIYMRVWHRGTDTMSPVRVPIVPGGNVLGNTGLMVTFSGTDRIPRDYWIIAVRPETPDMIMPWRLEHSGMGPMGVRTFMAPLAIIRWQLGPANVVVGEIIHDCRKTFRPLTDQETCCTFHVGDGMKSFGDYDSIEEAVANLPMEGGKICVLPGDHHCNLGLANRQNITICGCGEQSRIRPHETRVGEPIMLLANCINIKIEGLNFFARQDRAILLLDQRQGPHSKAITIRNNSILAVRNGIYVLTDWIAAGDNDIEIDHNDVYIPNIQGAGVGIFCLADGVQIHHNRVGIVPPMEGFPPGDGNGTPGPGQPPSVGNPCDDLANHDQDLKAYWDQVRSFVFNSNETQFLALGGIQLGGCTERAVVADNEVIGGAASGIILGHMPSMLEETRQPSQADLRWDEINRQALSTGLLTLATLTANEVGMIRGQLRPNLYRIELLRNNVSCMGMAGIGVMCFIIEVNGEPSELMVTVENFWANENRIQKCAMQVPSTTPESIMIGYGGIVMAQLEDGTFTLNEVKDCGRSHVEPICGIYIRSGQVFNIQGNRITNNGPDAEGLTAFGVSNMPVRKGSRGGIFIALAIKVELPNQTNQFSQQTAGPFTGNSTINSFSNSNSSTGTSTTASPPVSGGPLGSPPLSGGQFGSPPLSGQFGSPPLSGQFGSPPFGGGQFGSPPFGGGQFGSPPSGNNQSGDLLPDGRPAAMIHDNTVVQPTGQALFLIGLGPVSVHGNYFVTQDQDFTNPLTLLASTIFIINLGVSKDILRMGLEPSFLAAASPSGQPWINSTTNVDYVTLNLLYLFFQFLPSGQVLFNDNQVIFDQRDLLIDFSLCATAIISLDDVSFVSNQVECLGTQLIVPTGTGTNGSTTGQTTGASATSLGLDYMLTDVLILSASLRTSSNRFQEGFTGALLSLFSLALWNVTVGNISTNCLLALGLLQEEFGLNIERTLTGQTAVNYCASLRSVIGSALGQK